MNTPEELTAEDIQLLERIDQFALEGETEAPQEMPVCLELAALRPRSSLDFQRTLKRRLADQLAQPAQQPRISLRQLALPALGLLIIALFILLTPGGRAWARAVAHGISIFFTRSEADTIALVSTAPAPSPTPARSPTPEGEIPTIEGLDFYLSKYPYTLDDVAAIAGFELLIPSQLPPGFSFIGARYDAELDGVIYLYVFPNQDPDMDSVFVISQYRGGFDESRFEQIGPDAEVQTVMIGDAQGEYVEGGWLYVQDPLTPTAKPGETIVYDFHWERTAAPIQRLRWEQNGFLFEISFAGSDVIPGYLGLEDLIALAGSLE